MASFLSNRSVLIFRLVETTPIPSDKRIQDSLILTMSHAARYPRQKIRLPHPRSKSGCLVCRRQHKKCDERRPACSRCLITGKACQWPGSSVRHESDPEPERSNSFHDATLPPAQGSPVDANPGRDEIQFSPTPTLNEMNISGQGLCLVAPPSFFMDPVSSMFLAYFASETSRYLTTVEPEKNPFLTHMLPMAFSDELILHSLLALGGAHLERKNSSPKINACVCRHYGQVIYQLQDIISRKPSESIDWLRALLALLTLYLIGVCPSHVYSKILITSVRFVDILDLTCDFQVFSPVQDAGTIMHIRAGKAFVHQLLSASSKASGLQALYGLAFELYTYLALISSPTPYSNGTESELDTRSSSLLPSWDMLRDYGVFGVIVSPIYQFLEIIPRVVALCTRRQTEMTFDECSSESWAEFISLIGLIETIGHTDDDDDNDTLDSALNLEHRRSLLASAIYRHALTIFTYDAMWCGAIADESQLSTVRGHALSALALIPSLVDTHLKNILLWPTIVVGSCLLHEEERDIIRLLWSNREQVPVFLFMKMKTVLENLWAENDSAFFGPYGLQKHMLSHQTVIYLA